MKRYVCSNWAGLISGRSDYLSHGHTVNKYAIKQSIATDCV